VTSDSDAARARVLELFEQRYTPEPNSGCWLWTGSIARRRGYGTLCICHSGDFAGSWMAHRLAYVLFVGAIPPGRHNQVCHRCDNPGCVNPDHLWLGSPKENEQDKIAKGRRAPFTWKDRIARGDRSGLAKLREADIPLIRARRAAGETQQAIANDYGVSQRVISCIDLGITWKHVP
jgi:HNH endonuclease